MLTAGCPSRSPSGDAPGPGCPGRVWGGPSPALPRCPAESPAQGASGPRAPSRSSSGTGNRERERERPPHDVARGRTDGHGRRAHETRRARCGALPPPGISVRAAPIPDRWLRDYRVTAAVTGARGALPSEMPPRTTPWSAARAPARAALDARPASALPLENGCGSRRRRSAVPREKPGSRPAKSRPRTLRSAAPRHAADGARAGSRDNRLGKCHTEGTAGGEHR